MQLRARNVIHSLTNSKTERTNLIHSLVLFLYINFFLLLHSIYIYILIQLYLIRKAIPKKNKNKREKERQTDRAHN